jgi:branched-chain amino acid transport system substrate-binding protein
VVNVRVLVAVGVALVAAACTDDGASSTTIVPATTTTTTVPPRIDDGVLTVGVLLPQSGAGAALGQALSQAVVAAGDSINAAGGVLGQDIRILTGFDEGDSPSTARDSIAALIDQDVDAVIGPASSTVALATLGDLMRAGVLTCSPTATALALDGFPDRTLFVRTAPSDSLQAAAIAGEAERTGALTAAVLYLDDAYGRPLAEATITALRSRGIEVPDPVGFNADDESLLDEATTVKDSDPGVIVVIGDAEHGTRMLSNLGEVTGVVPGDDPPKIIVNDALRQPPSPQQIAELAPDVRARIVGLAPAATSGLAGEPAGPFATNAFDCLNLIALAAAQAGSDDPEQIAPLIRSVSEGGVTCRDYAECLALVVGGRNLDYDGPGGNVELGADGDPVTYRFDRWTFDEQGVDVPITVPALPPVPAT